MIKFIQQECDYKFFDEQKFDLFKILFSDKTCPICLEFFSKFETMPYVTKCNHVFHEGCILKYGLHLPCPICKYEKIECFDMKTRGIITIKGPLWGFWSKDSYTKMCTKQIGCVYYLISGKEKETYIVNLNEGVCVGSWSGNGPTINLVYICIEMNKENKKSRIYALNSYFNPLTMCKFWKFAVLYQYPENLFDVSITDDRIFITSTKTQLY